MNESSITRVLAIACAFWVMPSGCYLSHGPSGSDAGADGSTTDGNVVVADAGVDGSGSVDAEPVRDAGTDSVLPFDAGVVDPPPLGVRAVQLAAGREHVCALGDDGNVYCWGGNAVGQVAAGELHRIAAPARVAGLPPIASVHSINMHSCALDLEGGLWCWGANSYGQLIVPDSEIPECRRGAECSPIPLRAPVTQMDRAFIAHHGTCTRNDSGEVRCWGDDPAVQDVPIGPLTNAQTVDFGILHGCALDERRVVRCFGESDFGRTGDREDGIINLEDVVAVEVGSRHSCALTATGQVLCWGSHSTGALGVPYNEVPRCRHGDEDGACSPTPIAPTDVPPIRALSVGAHRTCAIAVAGGVGCWGAWTVNSGVFPCRTDSDQCNVSFTEVEGTSDAVAIEVGASVACIIDDEGAVHCWGTGEEGQLGNGTLIEEMTLVPVRVLGFGE